MSELVVRTKEDLEKAKNNLPDTIIFEGEMAIKIQKAIKRKKSGKKVGIALAGAGAVAAIIVGIVAAPVTAGASLGATAVGISNLTIGTAAGVATLSLTEVAIVAGVIVSALGVSLAVAKDLLKNYNMEFSNGVAKFTRKQ
ncbi:hypothetical protein [Treponema primitia]|uniref:hypothetical protein n=1 Tax=Treponema primitia TaxID=88058 RepID=UPI0002554D9E|nr:hypothetical protein [Treponema primitia]